VPSPFLSVVPWFFKAVGSSLTGQVKKHLTAHLFLIVCPPVFPQDQTPKTI
jgi:hypothetical protein